VLRIKVFSIPQCCQAGYRIKAFDTVNPRNCLVVIASHENLAEVSRPRSHLVWAGSVSNDVPEIEYSIVFWRSCQAGFQSLDVAMDIAEQQYAHEMAEWGL